MTICKKDDRLSHQNSIKVQYFYCKQKSKFIFRNLALKKHVKGLLQNIYLLLELLYHKRNVLITTVVDGSIFKEYLQL